jgi:acetylornithine deacetylase
MVRPIAQHAREALSFARELIRVKSVSGDEREVLELMEQVLAGAFEGQIERQYVSADRWNIFLSFGTPKIVFTTHLDVVDGSDQLFEPAITEDILRGRGACDAKGIAACMVAATTILRERNLSDFGLLFVVGEEEDGVGARLAAQELQNRGIEFLINGEPTEGKLALAHKGAIGFTATFAGKAAHSGSPEVGVDANRKMVDAAAKLYAAEERGDFGVDPKLGRALLNLGVFNSENPNAAFICPSAEIRFAIRSVSDNERVIATVQQIVNGLGEVRVRYSTPHVELHTVPNFTTGVMGFCTDIPNFAPLKTRNLLYGPGSILVAHGDDEHISLAEVADGIEGYVRLYNSLSIECSGATKQ